MKTKSAIITSIVAVICIACALVFALSGCTVEKTVNIGVPDGAPALALAELIATNPEIKYAEKGIDYQVYTSDATTEAAVIVGTKILNGDLDMAILPTNVAALRYKQGVKIKMLSVNTWGNLFMVSKSGVVESLDQLKGKTVYNISVTGTPNIIFKYLLEESKIEYTVQNGSNTEGKVNLEYLPAPNIMAGLKKDTIEYAILGEPAVTKATAVTGASVVFDLQQAWNDVTNSTNGYPQACLVVSTDFYEANKYFVKEFVNKLATNEEYLTKQENIDKVSNAVKEKAPSTALAGLNVETVGRCKVKFVQAKDAVEQVKNYLSAYNIEVDENFFVL